MQTIVFYSYKGGVGRSLLVANAARFVASQGGGVVALDLDLEAPGLHYKLEVNQQRGERPGGVVPYLVATAHGAVSPPPLDEHLIDIQANWPPGGWLRLMPAGPAPDKAYWAALKELGDQIRFDDLSGEGLMPLLDLHARIGEQLHPDYLLIDARTGVTELGGLATSILADIVVCMFVANQESVEGTLAVVEALVAAPRLQGQQPLRIVPTLTRTPTPDVPAGSWIREGLRRLLELGEARAADQPNAGEIFILPQDYVLQDQVVGDILHHRYEDLYEKLFPDWQAKYAFKNKRPPFEI